MTGPAVTPIEPGPVAPHPIEQTLMEQANSAMAAGANPQATTMRLRQMIQHVRSNPDYATQATDAIAKGADPSAVAGRIWEAAKGTSYSGEQAPAGVVPSALDAATFGLSRKGIAAMRAVPDVARGANFGEAYRQNLKAQEGSAEQYHAVAPKMDTAAQLAGGAAGIYLTGGLGAGEEAAQLTRLAKYGKTVAAGGKFGAASAAGHSDALEDGRGVTGLTEDIAKGGAKGAAAGFVSIPASAAAGKLIGMTPIPRLASATAARLAQSLPAGATQRALQSFSGGMGSQGPAAGVIARRAAMDEAGGFTPEAMHPSVPTMALDKAGPNVEGLAEGIANRPGPGRATIQTAIKARSDQMRPAITSAFNDATGTTEFDGAQLLRQLSDEQSARESASGVASAVESANRGVGPAPIHTPQTAWEAEVGDQHANALSVMRQMDAEGRAKMGEMYGAARAATAGQPMQSPTLDEIQQTPVGKLAFSWAKAQKGNRSSPMASVATAPKAPPGFSQDQWDEVLAKGGQTIRDESGKLRANLSNVHDDQLEEEWRRLAEMNNNEEALHSSVQEADYRHAYNELPRTEKLGADRAKRAPGSRAKELDVLPDADGQVDPDVLAGDNKIISDYNRSQVVRAARTKAMERIQAEQARRGAGTDFNFGANASPGAPAISGPSQTVPDPETVHYAKQYLAKLARMGVHDGAQGTIATQAQGALQVWGKIRGELPDVWRQADDAAAQHFRLMDAMNAGRQVTRVQSSPAGTARKALATSLEGLETRMGAASPEEQYAFRVGARSSVGDYLKGANPSAVAEQLRDPTSALSRRIALATGDNATGSRIAGRLAEQAPQQTVAAPPIPAVSPQSAAASRGLDVGRTPTNPTAANPDKSLAVLRRDYTLKMPQSERAAVRQGAAQSARGEWSAASGATKSPGRVFDFKSPERAEQLGYAFTDPASREDFKNAVASWDRVQQQSERMTGNSRTALRGNESSESRLLPPNQLLGRPRFVLRSIIGKLDSEYQAGVNQKTDADIAKILTHADPAILAEAMRNGASRARLLRGLQLNTARVGGEMAGRR